MPHGRNVAEAERAAGFHLPFVNGHDAAADDFRNVGAAVDAEREHGGDHFADAKGQQDDEINYHELHDHRRSADNGQVDAANCIAELHFARLLMSGADDCHDEAERYAYQNRKEGDLQCFGETAGQVLPAILFNKVGVKLIAEILPPPGDTVKKLVTEILLPKMHSKIPFKNCDKGRNKGRPFLC